MLMTSATLGPERTIAELKALRALTGDEHGAQRHLDAAALARMVREAREAGEEFARDAGVTVTWERLWRIAPRPFDPHLIGLCEEAIREVAGTSYRLPSGPLHDAAEMAGAGIPTVMMFVQSLHGISHNKIEDTKEEHLALCVRAFDRLVDKTLRWVAAGGGRLPREGGA